MRRFGLGGRAGEAPPDDPLAWLDAQTRGLPSPLPPPKGWEHQPSLAEVMTVWADGDAAMPFPPGRRHPGAILMSAQRAAWLENLLTAAEPVRERLVLLWTNHLTVSIRAGRGAGMMLGSYLCDAVRPNVTGRFEDLLVAAVMHPAMLYYLDQTASIGPDSPYGRRSRRGLNENLAREVLELHTLSPASGYTQADVTEFARLLTGWTVERARDPVGTVFRPQWHQPGRKTILGKTFEEGPEAAEAALRWLGTHPATYRHLALRMARHMVADEPPPEVVAHIEHVLADTGGDLGEATRAIFRLPAIEAEPLAKLRSPEDYVIAVLRAGGWTDPRPVLGWIRQLGQLPWVAPQPNGWPDTGAAWAGPEPMMRRLDFSYDIAGRMSHLDPMALLDTAAGPLARPETVEAVRTAGSKRDALSLVLASPEMQRR